MPNKRPKLNSLFSPETYLLNLHLDTEHSKFTGELLITGTKLGRPTNRITFNQFGLNVAKAEIERLGKKNMAMNFTPNRINEHKSFEELRIHTEQPLYPGKYTIRLNYSGKLTKTIEDHIISLVKSGIKPDNSCRSVLPCIDEKTSWESADFKINLV